MICIRLIGCEKGMVIYMAAILLGLLKIIGRIFLVLLCVVLILLLLILFVPFRYSAKAVRNLEDEALVRVSARVTWLLHAVSVAFWYPREEYLRVRIFGIPIFKAGKEEQNKERTDRKKQTDKEEQTGKEKQTDREKRADREKQAVKEENASKGENTGKEEQADRIENANKEENTDKEENTGKAAEEQGSETAAGQEKATVLSFFRKLWEILKNIKYTILKICDKIKHIIRNVNYYIRVLQSESFKRAWALCRDEAFSLIGSILPRKLIGHVTVGTGDPAGTAQILAVHGILYPLIGNHIFITPDFENSVLEGDFYMKGRITVFKILKTAGKVYFNKDLRRIIRLLKREAV